MQLKLVNVISVGLLILTGSAVNATACDFIVPGERAVCSDSVKPLSSARFIYEYGHLSNFTWCVQEQKKATVAFLGGSITNMTGWRDKVMQYLQEQYPATQFTFINAGIPSLGSLPHAFRLQRDVLDKGKIDLLFVESAVNDHGNGTTETEQRRALEGIVRHTLAANSATDIVMMAFVDEDKITDYNSGKVPLEIKVHEDIAKYYHLPFINLAEEITKRISNKEFTWKDDFKNLHPSPFGQQLYFQTIKQLLDQSFSRKKISAPVAAKIPVAIQGLNYSKAAYQPVVNAKELKGFAVKENWQPHDSARTRAGFAKIPVLEAEQAGASFEFTFSGTTVGLAVLAGPDAGMLEYTIDNGPVKKVDLYTRWSSNLHLPWYLLLGDDLDNRSHTIKVKIADEHNIQSKGNACRVAYFLVNGVN
ncbi:MAG: SGNH/GDSL hydrolase family protein [Chitinophagaceae bacterium]